MPRTCTPSDPNRSIPLLSAVDIVVVTYNSADCVGTCLRSLPAQSRVCLVENLPGDGSIEAALAVRPDAYILRPRENVGFGAACNLAIRASNTPYILLLNPDATVSPDCVSRLIEYMDCHPHCGGVGPLVLRSDDGRIDSAGMDLLAPGWARDRARGEDVLNAPATGSTHCLSGGVLLLRRTALEQIGRENEAFWGDLFLYNEDVELSMALRRGGWDLHFLREAQAEHQVGGSCAPRRMIRAMAARNRVVTGIVHAKLTEIFSPKVLALWTWRAALDFPRMLDNLRIPELRRDLPKLLAQVRERRRHIRSICHRSAQRGI